VIPPEEIALVFGHRAVARARPLGKPTPAATAGLWRVETPDDSAVLKLVALRSEGHPRWPAAAYPDQPYYWRREPLAYESGLLVPFGVPRVRACVERADGSIALWLEDGGGSPDWTPPLLGEVARRLGEAQRQLLDPPRRPWLGGGFVREYLRLHGVGDDALLERLEALPQTLCHNDFHPANVLERGLVVDWAYCGLGAPGLDAGVLVADGIADEAFPAELADEVEAAVWDGYLAGLAGAVDEGDVRLAFARGTALRLSWLPRGDRPAWDATIAFLERLASGA
jgi:hypothetical protein